MTTCPSRLTHRPLRAPCEDRAALVDPPLERVGTLVDENAALREQYDYDFQGRSLADLASQAREDLLREARRWTTAYRDADRPLAATCSAWCCDGKATERAGPIFLAGHQPQIFHPGVWMKNFMLGELARRHDAVAVNLLIDTDMCKSTSLRVPGGSVAEPWAETIPFDRPEPKIPYEQRRIVDRKMFSEFGRRVAHQIAPLVPDPLIGAYWPLAQKRMQQTDNLGACMAQARHQLEGQWGLETLEVPQSRVCETEPFRWFVAHLLARIGELWQTYNDAVSAYRRSHRIRSGAHPVPNLSCDGPWFEAPLWLFSSEDPRRRPLFARRRSHETVLSDRKSVEIVLALDDQRDAARAVEQLTELGRRGVRIRSRALITTLWARLVLGDLFVHGIGGAKYDQVTDTLIERLFGLKPPGFMVVSATLHLPIERSRVTIEQSRAIQQQLRRLVYHPERYIDQADGGLLGESQDPRELIAAKVRWIETRQTIQNARTRCRAIRRINEALQPWVESRRRQLQQRQVETSLALQAESVLAWREYGFCLYPEKTLREFLGGLLPKCA